MYSFFDMHVCECLRARALSLCADLVTWKWTHLDTCLWHESQRISSPQATSILSVSPRSVCLSLFLSVTDVVYFPLPFACSLSLLLSQTYSCSLVLFVCLCLLLFPSLSLARAFSLFLWLSLPFSLFPSFPPSLTHTFARVLSLSPLPLSLFLSFSALGTGCRV